MKSGSTPQTLDTKKIQQFLTFCQLLPCWEVDAKFCFSCLLLAKLLRSKCRNVLIQETGEGEWGAWAFNIHEIM
jgi:hypothetical protein